MTMEDDSQAIKNLEQNGTPESQYQLGLYYLIAKNYLKAIEWLQKKFEPPKKEVFPDYQIHDELPDFREDKRQRLGRNHAELGICHYYNGDLPNSRNDFKKSSNYNNGLGQLWLAYLNYLEKQPIKEEIEKECDYELAIIFESSLNSILNDRKNRQLFYSAIEVEKKISEFLIKAAVSLFLQKNFYYEDNFDKGLGFCNRLDVISCFFSKEIIGFLEHEKNASSKVILGLYYKQKNDIIYLDYLKRASDENDMLANYLLGEYYKESVDFDKATNYFGKVKPTVDFDISGNKEHPSLSSYHPNTQQFLSNSAKLESSNIEIKKLNNALVKSQKKLSELVQNTSHLAGNLLRPNTQEKIAKRLKNSEFNDESKKLYYASSDIKYVKQQFKLLEIIQSLTGSEAITNQIKLDQVDKYNNQSMTFEDILNLAAFRAIDKLFDTNEYSLDFARQTIERKQGDFSKLSSEYQKHVLVTNVNDNLPIISWCSDNLRPITINFKCDDWKKIFFHNNSQSVALFFCYFFELFFNAFKYADHNEHDFLTIILASEVINDNEFLTMIWKNPKGNQTSFGSNKGLSLSASYISLLNDDNYKDKSQELIAHSDKMFELITRIDRKIFNL